MEHGAIQLTAGSNENQELGTRHSRATRPTGFYDLNEFAESERLDDLNDLNVLFPDP